MSSSPTATVATPSDGLAPERAAHTGAFGSRRGGKLDVALRVGIMLCVFIAQQRAFKSAFSLEDEAYGGPSIALGLLVNIEAMALLLVPVLVLLLGPLAAGRRVARAPALTWRFEGKPLMRWFVTLMAAALAWYFATYPYNHYLDQWHAADRVLLVVLAAAVAWKPIFVLPLLALATTSANQFQVPLPMFALTHKEPLLDALNLFTCWLYIKTFEPRQRPWLLWMMLLSMMASHYFLPGYRKVTLNWAFEEDMRNLLLSARDNGWLAALPDATFGTILTLLSQLNVAFIVGTLLIELGVIVMLWRRGLAVPLLLGSAGLHLGIFATSGIFFWEWVLLDVVLAICVFLMSRGTVRRVFNGWTLFLSALLIAGGDWTFDSTALGWYDAPLSTTYRVEVVGESGAVYEVPPASLAPFDFPMSQGRFGFASTKPTVVNTYGSTRDLATLRRLRDATTPDEVRAAIDAGGFRYADERKRARRTDLLRDLLVTYFRHANDRVGTGEPLRWIKAPSHVWTYGVDPDLPDYARQERVVRLRVRREDRWLTPDPSEVVRSEEIIDLPID